MRNTKVINYETGEVETQSRWYASLVNDCNLIFDKASRSLVECYWLLGQRIWIDSAKTTLTKLLQGLAVSLGKSERTLWYAVDLYDKYPLLENVPELPWTQLTTGKNTHVSNNSGENEWYTPKLFIDAARQTMGSIDTDPASSDKANETVKAMIYYSEDDDGRTQKWVGNVWMNPPYAQPLIKEFIDAFIEKYENEEFRQACVLVNNATETEWFQSLLEIASSICLIKGRIKFIDMNGNPSGAPLQGQIILYFGDNSQKFRKNFKQFGKVINAT